MSFPLQVQHCFNYKGHLSDRARPHMKFFFPRMGNNYFDYHHCRLILPVFALHINELYIVYYFVSDIFHLIFLVFFSLNYISVRCIHIVGSTSSLFIFIVV